MGCTYVRGYLDLPISSSDRFVASVPTVIPARRSFSGSPSSPLYARLYLGEPGGFRCSACKVFFMGSSAVPERQRQRYGDDQYRLVAGCIPYKLTLNDVNCNDDIKSRLQVVMISSPDRDDLVFPKGGWEFEETEVEAASREAVEEAGVRGIIQAKLGEWTFRSKSSQKSGSLEGTCRGTMFALEVTEELPSWSEQEIHGRRWLNVREAFKLCRYEWMREALQKCVDFLSRETVVPVPDIPGPSFSAGLSPVRGDTPTTVSVLCVDGSA